MILEPPPPPKRVCHFHCFPIYLLWSDGTGCHDLGSLNVEGLCVAVLLKWTAWITSPLKVYNLTDRLVVLMPHTFMKWPKRPRKGDPERKVQSTRFTQFLVALLTGTLGVSWHWQVHINLWLGSLFGGCLQPLWGTEKLKSRAHHLLHSAHVIHSHKHTVELVK